VKKIDVNGTKELEKIKEIYKREKRVESLLISAVQAPHA
jgi:hypothetical protein